MTKPPELREEGFKLAGQCKDIIDQLPDDHPRKTEFETVRMGNSGANLEGSADPARHVEQLQEVFREATAALAEVKETEEQA